MKPCTLNISDAYNNTKRFLLSMGCELECSSSWSKPAYVWFCSPFHSSDLVWLSRSVGLCLRCTGIFLMANSSWTFLVHCKKNAVWNFFLFLLSYIFIQSRPIELNYNSEICMHILYLNKRAVPAECSYCSLSHYSFWPNRTIQQINLQVRRWCSI